MLCVLQLLLLTFSSGTVSPHASAKASSSCSCRGASRSSARQVVHRGMRHGMNPGCPLGNHQRVSLEGSSHSSCPSPLSPVGGARLFGKLSELGSRCRFGEPALPQDRRPQKRVENTDPTARSEKKWCKPGPEAKRWDYKMGKRWKPKMENVKQIPMGTKDGQKHHKHLPNKHSGPLKDLTHTGRH